MQIKIMTLHASFCTETYGLPRRRIVIVRRMRMLTPPDVGVVFMNYSKIRSPTI